LVLYYLCLIYIHVAINENLVSTRISHYGTIKTKEVVQTYFTGLVLEAFFEYVSICYHSFKTELVPEPLGRYRLNTRVYHGKQQRSLDNASLGLEFSNAPEQIFFLNFETHW
jgi:hypothetical protein